MKLTVNIIMMTFFQSGLQNPYYVRNQISEEYLNYHKHTTEYHKFRDNHISKEYNKRSRSNGARKYKDKCSYNEIPDDCGGYKHTCCEKYCDIPKHRRRKPCCSSYRSTKPQQWKSPQWPQHQWSPSHWQWQTLPTPDNKFTPPLYPFNFFMTYTPNPAFSTTNKVSEPDVNEVDQNNPESKEENKERSPNGGTNNEYKHDDADNETNKIDRSDESRKDKSNDDSKQNISNSEYKQNYLSKEGKTDQAHEQDETSKIDGPGENKPDEYNNDSKQNDSNNQDKQNKSNNEDKLDETNKIDGSDEPKEEKSNNDSNKNEPNNEDKQDEENEMDELDKNKQDKSNNGSKQKDEKPNESNKEHNDEENNESTNPGRKTRSTAFITASRAREERNRCGNLLQCRPRNFKPRKMQPLQLRPPRFALIPLSDEIAGRLSE